MEHTNSSTFSTAGLSALAFAASLGAACDRLGERTQMAATPDMPARTASPAPVGVEEGTPRPPESPLALPSTDTLSDAVIAAQIRASLLTDPAMSGADVSVNADRGVVNLSGTVLSQEQSAIASAHAQRHDGVMRIESHLSVKQQ